MAAEEFYVKIWGARGTIPAPGPSTVKYGGNTSCVEIRCGDRVLVFDAGTGIRELGRQLSQESVRSLDLFFTHCHYDHIEGLPFFSPLYDEENVIRIWAGHLGGERTPEEMVCDYMSRPYFPISPDYFWAQMNYHDFKPADEFDAGDGITIKTAELNHPDGAVGYRVEYGGRSICYVTDTEHVPGAPDANVMRLISDADIVIYDAMFTDEEFEKFAGYGHSTWQEGVRLCDECDAGQLVVFHHRPDYDDATLDGVTAVLQQARPGSLLAQEGMVLRPGQ